MLTVDNDIWLHAHDQRARVVHSRFRRGYCTQEMKELITFLDGHKTIARKSYSETAPNNDGMFSQN